MLEESHKLSEEELLGLFNVLFSLILYKKNTKCCFLYSVCLSKNLSKDLSLVIL